MEFADQTRTVRQKEQRRQKLLRFLAGEAIATLVLLGAIASASRDGLPRIPRGC